MADAPTPAPMVLATPFVAGRVPARAGARERPMRIPMQPQPYDPVPDFERRLDELIRAALAIKANPWRITAVLDIRADRTRMRACAEAETRNQGE
jgi:hypothetical protein